MILMVIFIAPIIIMVIGMCLLTIEDDKEIWSSAWNNFKNKIKKMKRGQND